jgi:hypothetical protein
MFSAFPDDDSGFLYLRGGGLRNDVELLYFSNEINRTFSLLKAYEMGSCGLDRMALNPTGGRIAVNKPDNTGLSRLHILDLSTRKFSPMISAEPESEQ